MKNLFALVLGLCLAAPAFAVTGNPGIPLPAVAAKQLNLNPSNPPATLRLGSQVISKKLQVLKAVYDPTVVGGASGATVTLRDADAPWGDAVIPDNAIVKDGAIDTITALSGSGSPTVALGLNTTTDIKGATAIASYTGVIATVPVGTAATSVKMTAQRALTATIAAGTVSAGKFNVFLEYYLSD